MATHDTPHLPEPDDGWLVDDHVIRLRMEEAHDTGNYNLAFKGLICLRAPLDVVYGYYTQVAVRSGVYPSTTLSALSCRSPNLLRQDRLTEQFLEIVDDLWERTIAAGTTNETPPKLYIAAVGVAAGAAAVRKIKNLLSWYMPLKPPSAVLYVAEQMARSGQDADVMEAFFSAEGVPNVTDFEKKGFNLVWLAAGNKSSSEPLEWLIGKGASLEGYSTLWQVPPLHVAASRGLYQHVKILLDRGGVDVDFKEHGVTALQYALNAERGVDLATVKILLERGASLKPPVGRMALSRAEETDRPLIAKYLRDRVGGQ